MNVITLMQFLEENISENDKKLFNKVETHANKRHQKNLIMLLTKYKVERKKFIFATPNYINEAYVDKVRELILTCKNIIENKIDISGFNALTFCVNKLLDISTISKVNDILYTIKSYTMFYPNLTVSQELVDSPLMILTPDTKKKLDMQLLERHALEYCSNIVLVEDYNFNLDDNPSSPDRYKKNLIVDTGKFNDNNIKDAIIDYFKNSDDLYYICDDVQTSLTENLKKLITDKKTKKINIPVFLLTAGFPLLNLCIAVVLLLINAISHNSVANILLTLSILFSISMLCYYAKLLQDENKITKTQFYLQNGKLTFETLKYILLSTITAQIINLVFFNDAFVTSTSSLISSLDSLQMVVVLITSISSLIGIGVLLHKFLSIKIETLLSTFIILMLVFILFVRTNFLGFEIFGNTTVFISALCAFVLSYMVATIKGKEFLYGMYVGVFVIDYIASVILMNNVYLKYSLFNENAVANQNVIFIIFSIIIVSLHIGGLTIFNKKNKTNDSKI